jgi:uncharacterized protein
VADNLAPTTAGATPAGLRVRIETRISRIDRNSWDRLEHGPSPFLRHGFLSALEGSASVGPGSGWAPVYLIVETDDESGAVLGATAAWLKGHSYGEYIFDWSWASAAARYGVDYYPKLVIAAPMTPATGNRILLAPGADADMVTAALAAAARAVADDAGASSIHWLFCTAEEEARLARLGFAPRATFQFHWKNRGYATYDDFLAALASRKRKQLKKERARVAAAIDGLAWIGGRDLSSQQLDALDRYYRRTVEAHGGHDYLREGFFHLLAAELPDELVFAEVRAGGAPIAGAVFLETAQGLYGRYWGSDRHVEFLHFETAYYAGIERCIARGIPLFEAGAQGEHKLVRGFEPARTHSAHWIRDPRLFGAVRDFLAREHAAVAAHMAELADAGPFRKDG